MKHKYSIVMATFVKQLQLKMFLFAANTFTSYSFNFAIVHENFKSYFLPEQSYLHIYTFFLSFPSPSSGWLSGISSSNLTPSSWSKFTSYTMIAFLWKSGSTWHSG